MRGVAPALIDNQDRKRSGRKCRRENSRRQQHFAVGAKSGRGGRQQQDHGKEWHCQSEIGANPKADPRARPGEPGNQQGPSPVLDRLHEEAAKEYGRQEKRGLGKVAKVGKLKKQVR